MRNLFRAKKPKPTHVIRIGEVGLPEWLEARNFYLSGTVGAGKTQAIKRILGAARARGDSIICLDAGAELMMGFWESGDTLLNPLDARSARWDPLGELDGPGDYPQLASALIPPAPSSDGETWLQYGRSILRSLMPQIKNLDKFYEALFLLPSYVDPENPDQESLQQLLEGSTSGRLFEPGSNRMLASVLSVIATSLDWLALAKNCHGAAWSARDFVSQIDSGRGRAAWLPVSATQVKSLAGYGAAIVEELTVQILSLPPSSTRRVWLFIDEFGQYPAIASLILGLSQGRKYGLRILLGSQSVAQITAAYGAHRAQICLSNLGTKLLLRSGDSESAQWASQEIGAREITRRTRGKSDHGWSESEQVATESTVLPSEISRLPDRHGYLIAPGDYPVGSVEIPIQISNEKVAAFVPLPEPKNLKPKPQNQDRKI